MIEKGWSIRYEDWESLAQAMQTANFWKSALLTPNDQLLIPEKPGVYAICARPPMAGSRDQSTMFHRLASPIYIGRSESSIRSRFLDHCKAGNPPLRKAKHCYGGQLRFWFIEMPIGSVKNAEAWLIKCFGPPVNRVAGTITGTLKPPVRA